MRSDTVGVTMLVLVSFIGWVVVRYSERYLAGDPNQAGYVRRLLTTVACVAVVVVANHVVLLLAAWTATSPALHGLLTFFGDRPVAVAVAHKKFILARCADLAMVGSAIAFASAFDTLRIDQIAERASAAAHLPAAARVGILLVALAALLKCAQLPFHGWLIQVMEAPTPVSALLHAGVVNLGGFVLLRFAPVVDRSIETRTLLVVAGTATAVLAALVMTTRISIKVALAWSTCAQMGFMLMQCGLGLWEMALVHLVAHSLYKAHAFLGAGGTVRQTQRKQLAPAPGALTVKAIALGAVLAIAGVFATGWAWALLPFAHTPSATVWVMGGIVALAVVPLTTRVAGRHGSPFSTPLLGAVTVPLAYFAVHSLAERLVPHAGSAPAGLLVLVGASFAALFVAQVHCTVAPGSPLTQRLYPWVYGGLFLDEAFTRVAFTIWPPPMPKARPRVLPRPTAVAAVAVPAPDNAPPVPAPH